ncbi:MAG: membrane protein insertase YidC [Mariprofundales bacterium]|nr:membrane protein insertase YidC [Mariprofundales bacterium]
MEQRNMMLAFALSLVVLLGWQMLNPEQKTAAKAGSNPTNASQHAAITPHQNGVAPPTLKDEGATATATATTAKATTVAAAPLASSTIQNAGLKQEATAIAHVGNNLIDIAINSRGTLIQASLKQYRTSLAPNAPQVNVLHLSPTSAQYINSGIMQESAPIDFSVVRHSAGHLTLQAPLTDGRIWQRTLSLKPNDYEVSIDDRIKGGAGNQLYLQAVQRDPNKKLNTFYEHAGPIGLLGGKLQEPVYKDLDKENGSVRNAGVGGWTGIMSRYFLTAIYGDQHKNYRYFYKGDGRSYQAGMILNGITDGQDAVFHTKLFIGPKSISLLKTFGVGLERSVDFGIVSFIAKPMHSFMNWLYHYIPNFGVCIILLVVLIKIIFYWPSKKSYTSMAAMRKIQPEMKKMQKRYADDRQKLGSEMMKLYKTHKVNPLSGCLPMIIQIPVFFSLYKVLLMSIEMRQAPFMGWIHDLSVNDPWFILPVLMGGSMFIQMRLNPQPPDPMQAKVMQFLPIIFTVMFLFFPAGLVLYWLVNNVLSITQQRFVMKRMGAV